ncbi:MAG: hypothetical protein HOG89_02780 [Candidatus Peribacter sp.]|jgi:hypothetical protein|nr:hypothetical protein [Candidatus Peribacter sp.]MBT4392716.1 hypothetical protein [Candidatus Peribacter sp.]MBT4600667.1 hypothetical protein [Candidatus Peribacter sp.]MBT5148664.1 hypothetical protein [Candidatus Peribacter sp.]MBT5637741.1 hypothetical protein [Candidatus Peribacter sp.]
MMILRNTTIAVALLPCLLLAACGGDSEPNELHVSGAKTSVSIMHILSKRSVQNNRPSGVLGIFSGIYTSQGVFLPVQGALEGMKSLGEIMKGSSNSTSDENFSLLREVGDILQVNVVDALNRSSNRSEAIDAYTQSLRNVGILAERKMTELSSLNKEQKGEVKEKRDIARNFERSLREVLRNQDYSQASELEQQLAVANADHAEIKTTQDQTNDMIKRFDTLHDVIVKRLQAVEANREILIAGLRVIDVPGIVDFNILEEGKPWRKKKGSSILQKKYELY